MLWIWLLLFLQKRKRQDGNRSELPFKMGNEIFGYKVDEKVIIDLSKYESLAIICRWFFRIMFILGLVMITRYLIKG